MTIDELNVLTTLTAADEVPVWDSEESGEPTKKITASNLAASVKSLASLPNTTEMNAAIQQSTANKSHIIVKPYNIALTANSYVAPFTHFGSSTLPYTHNLGEIISVTSRNPSAVANFDRGQYRVTVVGTDVTSVIVDVVFATNVETKPID